MDTFDRISFKRKDIPNSVTLKTRLKDGLMDVYFTVYYAFYLLNPSRHVITKYGILFRTNSEKVSYINHYNIYRAY
jgi:hypothetical protein